MWARHKRGMNECKKNEQSDLGATHACELKALIWVWLLLLCYVGWSTTTTTTENNWTDQQTDGLQRDRTTYTTAVGKQTWSDWIGSGNIWCKGYIVSYDSLDVMRGNGWTEGWNCRQLNLNINLTNLTSLDGIAYNSSLFNAMRSLAFNIPQWMVAVLQYQRDRLVIRSLSSY